MSAELRLATPATSNPRPATPGLGPHLQPEHQRGTADPVISGNDIENIVASNLSRLRALQHLSLDALARKSGVSRAMLAQIESSRSVPTIRVLQRVATALQVSVAAFLRNFAPQGIAVLPLHESPRLVSGNGHFSSRSLHPGGERRFEFHELKLDAIATEHLNTALPGTQKNLVVTHGTLEIQINEQRQLLGTGDAIFFDADQSHSYRNPANAAAVAYVVTQYPEARIF
jgi:transcriptional regulator with XRE-family HTH domain